jgi:hypothetical protein
VHKFVSNYHRLYLKKHAGMTASNYDKLELQVHEPSYIAAQLLRKCCPTAVKSVRRSGLLDRFSRLHTRCSSGLL